MLPKIGEKLWGVLHVPWRKPANFLQIACKAYEGFDTMSLEAL
jgi:hypothetical protein